MANYAILKDNVVIAKIMWDGISSWQYPFPHDSIIHDANNQLHVGSMLIDGEWIYQPLPEEQPDNPIITQLNDRIAELEEATAALIEILTDKGITP